MSTQPAGRPASARRAGALAPRPMVLLHPGQLCVSREALAAATLVETGVAVCLYDDFARVGGAVHFVLPEADPSSARGAQAAIPMLLARMEERGAQRANLVAKIFGGTRIADPAAAAGQPPLGARNVASAREHLIAAGVPIVCVNAGGERARQLVYFCDTGQAFVQPV